MEVRKDAYNICGISGNAKFEKHWSATMMCQIHTIHITFNMSRRTHTDHIIANANFMLGSLKKNFMSVLVS